MHVMKYVYYIVEMVNYTIFLRLYKTFFHFWSGFWKSIEWLMTVNFQGITHTYIIFFQLLQHVRLPLLSRNFLTSHVDNEPLLHGDPDCQALQLEALKYHLLPEQRSSFTSQRTLQRKPQGFKPYIFAVGKLEREWTGKGSKWAGNGS